MVPETVRDRHGVRWVKFSKIYASSTGDFNVGNAYRELYEHVDEENIREYQQLEFPGTRRYRFTASNRSIKYVNNAGLVSYLFCIKSTANPLTLLPVMLFVLNAIDRGECWCDAELTQAIRHRCQTLLTRRQ